MSQVSRLIENYQRFVRLPWPANLAGKQRVWFAVYPPSEERRIRARLQEFEIATRDAAHRWHQVDITGIDARWLGTHDYREDYFAEPTALATVEQEFKARVVTEIRAGCEAAGVDSSTVVAVLGAGSLFGYVHVSSIISAVEDHIKGRLLIFFPGEYERNLYRFMDARDGFNYMAVPITCGEMINV